MSDEPQRWPMRIPLDSDVERFHKRRGGYGPLIPFLSWCLWRTSNGFDQYPPEPARVERGIKDHKRAMMEDWKIE